MAYCAYCGNDLAAVSEAPCPHCGNPSNGAPRRGAAVSGGAGAAAGGKTIGIVIGVVVGVLFLVAVAGIIAAIAIPNFITARERAAQKRTMADLRTLGTTLEMYATDRNEYPRAGAAAEKLGSFLTPEYAKQIPTKDGWGHDLRYECWPPEDACTEYAIGSPGKDGIWTYESLQEYEPGVTTDFNADIIWSGGEFVQYPMGTQVQ